MTAEESHTRTAQRIRRRWSTAGKSTNIDVLNYRSDGGSPIQWNAGQSSADQAIRYNAWQARNKSRALETGNAYAERFLHALESNVLSSEGMTLQMQVKDPDGSPDKYANESIEEAWYQFRHRGNCDVTGELSGLDADKLLLRSVARDGDMLVRIIRGFNNDWKFALQFIEADQLDPNYNEVLGNGNEIRMSVEIDKWGRRVAYHITPYHPGDWQRSYTGSSSSYTDKMRIPAEGFQTARDNTALGTAFMPFIQKRVGQTRGWPWLTPVIDDLNCLSKGEEAELVASRACAEKMNIWERSAEAEEYTGERDSKGNFIEESAPGSTQIGPPGYTHKSYDPHHPNGSWSEFRKIGIRKIASGIGMSYGSLANDRSDSSFSAERSAIKDEQETYKMMQRWMTDSYACVVFSAWLEMLLLNKLVNLPIEKFDKFNQPWFQGRRWGYLINPAQEINSDILAVQHGFKSRRAIIAENGGYIEDVNAEVKQDRELDAKDGLVFGVEPRPQAPDAPYPDSIDEPDFPQDKPVPKKN